MKTSELIRRLQEADPSGEMECCVENADIHFVGVEPAYWDGCLQVLVHDPAKAPYYDIVGAKYVSRGKKLVISTLSISDAIFDNEDLPVDYSELEESWRKRYAEWVDHRRKETRDISNGVEKDYFVQYIVQRFAYQMARDFEPEEVKAEATKFYEANMTYKDAMPDDILTFKKKLEDGKEVWPSWNERRRMQWDREIKLDFENGKIKLAKV